MVKGDPENSRIPSSWFSGSVCLSACQSVSPSVKQSASLSVCLFAWLLRYMIRHMRQMVSCQPLQLNHLRLPPNPSVVRPYRPLSSSSSSSRLSYDAYGFGNLLISSRIYTSPSVKYRLRMTFSSNLRSILRRLHSLPPPLTWGTRLLSSFPPSVTFVHL